MKIASLRNGLGSAIIAASRRLEVPRLHLTEHASMTDADMIRHYHDTGSILVWVGASDHTIYGAPRLNWLFRGWHDYCHILSGVCNRRWGPLGCFEPRAEYRVADFQCAGLGDRLAALVQCEVSAQAAHFEATGNFVDDQVRFTLDNLKANGIL